MIRRFNYTQRRSIPRDQVAVQLIPQPTGPATFNATVSLDGSDLPSDARVYLEAHYKSSYMRFPFGTVGALHPPENRTLSDIDRGTSVLFRVKIVDEAGAHGRILAELDDIVANESGDGDTDRYCILPVDFRDLGQEMWRINFDSRPILEVNLFEGVEQFVRDDSAFAALVFPAAVRAILTHVLLILEHDLDASDDEWPSMWLKFASSFLPEPPPELEEPEEVRLAWIDDVVRSFCDRQRFTERLVTARREERA